MPWAPGESGNKAGRPKGSKRPDPLTLRQLKRHGEKYSQEMLENLVLIANGEIEGTKVADRRAASRDVLEWTYGRPGVRNDDEGLPEGFLAWPLEKQLDWVRDEIRKHKVLEAALEAKQQKAAG